MKCCQWMYSQPLFTVDKNLPSVILPVLTIVGFEPAAKWLMQESFGGYTSRDDNFHRPKLLPPYFLLVVQGWGEIIQVLISFLLLNINRCPASDVHVFGPTKGFCHFPVSRHKSHYFCIQRIWLFLLFLDTFPFQKCLETNPLRKFLFSRDLVVSYV